MAIGGSLNFGSMSGGAGLLQGYGDLNALSSNYARNYNSALDLSQQNYNNILGGYQQNQNALQSGYGSLDGGYGSLAQSAIGYLGGGGAYANTPAVYGPPAGSIAATPAVAPGSEAQVAANRAAIDRVRQQYAGANTAAQYQAGQNYINSSITPNQAQIASMTDAQKVAASQSAQAAERQESLAFATRGGAFDPNAHNAAEAARVQSERQAAEAAANAPNPWVNYATGGVGANGVVGSGSVGPAGTAGGSVNMAGGYAGLNASVVNALRGIGAAKEQEINDQYSALMGQQTQRLIDSGITNSTVLQSVARGVDLDRQKASIANSNQVSGQVADYMSRIGLAGLDQQNQNRRFDIDQSNTMNRFGRQLTEGARQFDVGQSNTMSRARAELAAQIGLAGLSARERGLNAVADQGNKQLSWMNSVNIPYPDAGAYTQLAAQYGQVQQQNFDRLLAAQQAQQDREAAVRASQIALAQANRAPAATYGGTTMGAGPSFGSGPQGYYGAAPAPALQGAGGFNPYANTQMTPMASAYLAGGQTYGGGYAGVGGSSTAAGSGQYGSGYEDLYAGSGYA